MMRRFGRDSRRSGQAAVETAIISSMFIFMIVGTLQLSLLFQSKALLKYAAYRAARAGAMHHACIKPMTNAALSALVPVIALNNGYPKAASLAGYATAFGLVGFTNLYPIGLKIVDVRICGPRKEWVNGGRYNTFHPGGDNKEVDFDDMANRDVTGSGADGIKSFERTRLRIQVKYNQRMIIPYANFLLFTMWVGQQLPQVALMDQGNQEHLANDLGYGRRKDIEDLFRLNTYARAGHFFMPMYQNYAFRMQSNIYQTTCPLPAESDPDPCFHYVSGNGGT